ncbi:MAG: 2-dehydro-3-deoxy-D-gluconate 5-dehydrogenase KduD [Protaetiibacter sp.]
MIIDSFRLDGRVALVTGASRGLGRAAAIALADAGADVVLVGRGEPAETVDRIREHGRRVRSIRCDLAVAAPERLGSVVDDAVATFGRLDILVNNAGIIRRAPAVEHAASDWDEVLAVNLDAVFHLSQAAGRHLLAQGRGRIINIASMLSFQGGVDVPGYTASKHAVVGLTRALASEWSVAGVTVNAIAPGYMATDNTAPLRADDARAAAIVGRIPTGRWGTPDDLCGAVVFLASDAASYVSGAVMPVDGGWLVR